MPDWTAHLTPAERARLAEIISQRRELMAEKLRLHDLAKKRKKRSP